MQRGGDAYDYVGPLHEDPGRLTGVVSRVGRGTPWNTMRILVPSGQIPDQFEEHQLLRLEAVGMVNVMAGLPVGRLRALEPLMAQAQAPMFFNTGIPPTPSDLGSMAGQISPNDHTIDILRHTHQFVVRLQETVPPHRRVHGSVWSMVGGATILRP